MALKANLPRFPAKSYLRLGEGTKTLQCKALTIVATGSTLGPPSARGSRNREIIGNHAAHVARASSLRLRIALVLSRSPSMPAQQGEGHKGCCLASVHALAAHVLAPNQPAMHRKSAAMRIYSPNTICPSDGEKSVRPKAGVFGPLSRGEAAGDARHHCVTPAQMSD